MNVVLSKTLAINAAFLEEIKDSNVALWNQVAAVRDLCQSHEIRSILLNRLVNLLNELRDSLALQFALEESYGYVEIASPPKPPLCLQAEDVRSQHCVLYLTVSELAEQAEELQYRGWEMEHVDALVGRVKLFELQLALHESQERQMLKASRADHHHRA